MKKKNLITTNDDEKKDVKTLKEAGHLPLYDEKLLFFGLGGSFGVVSPGE